MIKLDTGLINKRQIKLVRQTEMAECGLACLAMIANHYGHDIDLGTMRRMFSPSMRGASLKSLVKVADHLGLSSRAVKLQLDALSKLHVPAIIHWDLNHFVVLEKVNNRKALIHNPDGRSRWFEWEELSKHFTGVALELRPCADFKPIHRRSVLRIKQLWSNISGLKRSLLQILILSLILQVFVISMPYYMQLAVDTALPALDGSLLTVLAIGFGIFTIINAGASLLRSYVLLSAGTNLGYGLALNIARKLLRLPIDWFDRRHVGDVLSRFQSIKPVQVILTEGAIASIVDGALACITLTVMFFYSPLLALISLVTFAFYGAVRWLTFSMQRDTQEEAIINGAKEQSVMIESLRGITTLRLSNKETMRHTMWQSRLAESMNSAIQLSRIGIWQSLANTTLFGLESIIIIWLGVGFVMDGGFSIGMLFAYIAYKTQFLEKSRSLIDQSISFRMIGLHLERLSDIAMTEDDVSFSGVADRDNNLVGEVKLEGIRYSYSPNEPAVIRDVSLKIAPGEHVAITGPSGGGKSTLVKILLGLVEPQAGKIIIDGMPLDEFGRKSFLEQTSAVLQDDALFAGSIADNIALFDEEPDNDRVIAASRAASIHTDIERMPMGYETLIGDMGSSLSGGQKQRILLARALYRKPKVLVMDEGTAHLDAQHEKAVNAAIAQMGITRIIIAHRRETILAADRILVLFEGQVQEVSREAMLVPAKMEVQAA